MRTAILTLCLAVLAAGVQAQTASRVLATATGHTIRESDLSPETQAAIANMPATTARVRTQLLEQMITNAMLDAEAKAQNTTVEKLIDAAIAKAAAPTEAEIKSIYDANLAALENRPLAEVRPKIVEYLKSNAEQAAFQAYADTLKAKYKPANGKDVNAAGLKPADVVATVTSRTITAQEFEEKNKVSLYELQASLGDQIAFEIDNVLFSTLIADEARSLGIDPGSLIAREISDKLKDYSDDERTGLEDALRKKLFTKYAAKIVYEEPKPLVLNISADDDPAQGPATAPVTVVMFSDFQCPACSATHPVLKAAIAAYPGKIRFVVRDFPLTDIHDNAFRAALAAGAANVQGKFFEFAEILYRNQKVLDEASLKRYAAESGLNVKQFEIDFNSEKTAAEVKKDMADGDSYGINSTPTIYVNGVKVRDLSLAGFRKAIDRALAK